MRPLLSIAVLVLAACVEPQAVQSDGLDGCWELDGEPGCGTLDDYNGDGTCDESDCPWEGSSVQSQVGNLRARLGALELRHQTLEDRHGELESAFGDLTLAHVELLALASGADDRQRADHVRLDGLDEEIKTALVEVAALQQAHEELTNQTVKLVHQDLTLQVRPDPGPGEFGDLRDALRYLDDRRIVGESFVNIHLADHDDYRLDDKVQIRHPDSGRIRILGNVDDPGAVVLAFDGEEGGLVMSKGSGLGRLEGMTLRRVGRTSATGISLFDRAALRAEAIAIDNFGVGVYAAHGAVGEFEGLQITGGVYGVYGNRGGVIMVRNGVFDGMQLHGILASAGAQVHADEIEISSTTTAIYAGRGAYVGASRSRLIDSSERAMIADYNSTVFAYAVTVSATGLDAVMARSGSYVRADLAAIDDVGGAGIATESGSHVYAPGASLSNVGVGCHAKFGGDAVFANSTGDIDVVETDGGRCFQ